MDLLSTFHLKRWVEDNKDYFVRHLGPIVSSSVTKISL